VLLPLRSRESHPVIGPQTARRKADDRDRLVLAAIRLQACYRK
jgi:hypothetical protein